MIFKLYTTSLENLNLKDGFNGDEACRPAMPAGRQAGEAGAFCAFEGRVRNHSDGRKVIALEYEALDPLCQKEAGKIFQEVGKKFNVLNVTCCHRVGKLSVGEMAVWVGVSASHRDDAFKACRYIIDEIKARLPIWKKEFYADGDSGWVNGQNNVAEQHAMPHSIPRPS